jgi:UDP-glucose 4-epimerase
MSILVTGGAGYIGSHMVYALTDAGQDVVVLDNLTTGLRGLVSEKAHFVQGDAGDLSLVKELIAEYRVDAIIHFAGSIVVPDSVADPLGYYANNTVVARNLIEAAVKSGVKAFIFSSTATVYAGESPALTAAPS